jgi:ribosome maturation factor RimP
LFSVHKQECLWYISKFLPHILAKKCRFGAVALCKFFIFAIFSKKSIFAHMNITKAIKKWTTQLLGENHFVVEIACVTTKSKSKIDILIDGDNGVDKDKCAEITLGLKKLIDESGLVPNYTLDVSAPTLDRPLTLVRQCRQYIGKTLRIEDNPDPERNYPPIITEGTLISIQKNTLTLYISKSDKKKVNFDLASRITVVNDFY